MTDLPVVLLSLGRPVASVLSSDLEEEGVERDAGVGEGAGEEVRMAALVVAVGSGRPESVEDFACAMFWEASNDERVGSIDEEGLGEELPGDGAGPLPPFSDATPEGDSDGPGDWVLLCAAVARVPEGAGALFVMVLSLLTTGAGLGVGALLLFPTAGEGEGEALGEDAGLGDAAGGLEGAGDGGLAAGGFAPDAAIIKLPHKSFSPPHGFRSTQKNPLKASSSILTQDKPNTTSIIPHQAFSRNRAGDGRAT